MRMPLNIVDFWFQDAYTLHPAIYKRTRLANARFNQINDAPNNPQATQLGRLTATDPGDHPDQTTRLQRDLIFGSWLLTEPVKISSTLFLDGLAAQPWKNMLRRTRTMFERESEFLPELTYTDVQNLAIYQSNLLHKPVDPVALLDQINSTGRTGAVDEFCDYAQQRLAALGLTKPEVGPRYPTITLVGHSMGAIVGCEVVSRFHQLPLDNLVFEGAACSIRDFKKEVVPYLEEQNLRESIWSTFKTQYGIKDATASPVRKTHFFDLCLHDNSENGEENPGNYDLSERGSLLTWIDILYQNPESENDRCLGRWVNAILSTDDIPKDILNRITIKEFGRNRTTASDPIPPQYGFERINGKTILEPMKHGDFTRFNEGPGNIPTNLEFWATRYRHPEKPISSKTQLTTRTRRTSAPPSQSEHKTIGAD
jgi:pimeloyl-ACP methyl ester carboxylesterase